MSPARASRRGFTILEGAIATIVVIIVSLAAAATYAEARVTEVHEWHEQNGLFLAEREVESWQAAGYNGLAGWDSTDVVNVASPNTTTFLPYGYSFANPDSGWNQTTRLKPVSLNGFDYRIRAQQLFNASSPTTSPTDFYIEDNWNNGTGVITSRYRLLRVVVQWGTFTGVNSTQRMVQETRIAR